jgi:hypothetical protein
MGTVRAPDPAPRNQIREDQQLRGDPMSTWTLKAIRALGVRTDLPTLGKIFGISRTRAYQMAHTGEWERAGIRVVPLGSKYVVAVQSILDVLGGTGTGVPSSQPGDRRMQSAARTTAGDR